MSYITSEMTALIGVPGEVQTAPVPLSADMLRRFTQAVMESDPVHWDPIEAAARGYATPVATPLQPLHLFTRAAGTPDTFEKFKDSPDWDGMGGTVSKGLPSLKLPFKRLLNGGYACEFFRFAQLGDVISRQSTYIDLAERESSSGPMIVFKTETIYTNQNGEKLLRIVHTELAR